MINDKCKILVTGGAGFTPIEQLAGLQNFILSHRALSTGRVEILHLFCLRSQS